MLTVLPVGLSVCVVVAIGYWLFLCVLAYRQRADGDQGPAAAETPEWEGGGEKGLTVEELERLEEGKMAVGGGGECVVCWDKMGEAHAVRVLPGCRHAFHRSCIDAWLQLHPSCPLCRTRILPHPSLPPSQPQPQSPSS